MPLFIIRHDITRLKVDAVIKPSNPTLLGEGGVDGAIHRAAGSKLLEKCKALGGCKTGKAKITDACNMPCKYIIHTVGPVWQGGNSDESKLLESCYKASLTLAKRYKCQTVAFPLISTGAYGYPKNEAFRIAVEAINGFLSKNDMTVYLVVFDKQSLNIGEKLFADIEQYINDSYVESHTELRRIRPIHEAPVSYQMPAPITDRKYSCAMPMADMCLDDVVAKLDESFSQMLLRKIDEKGMTDAQCYKKANIDRKLFSKIRSDVNYKPSKTTAIAFAISLELELHEAEDLLKKAGYALSHSNKFDIIIEYFISRGIYDIYKINEALFAFDQSLLGA